jgi:hypothetical protein
MVSGFRFAHLGGNAISKIISTTLRPNVPARPVYSCSIHLLYVTSLHRGRQFFVDRICGITTTPTLTLRWPSKVPIHPVEPKPEAVVIPSVDRITPLLWKATSSGSRMRDIFLLTRGPGLRLCDSRIAGQLPTRVSHTLRAMVQCRKCLSAGENRLLVSHGRELDYCDPVLIDADVAPASRSSRRGAVTCNLRVVGCDDARNPQPCQSRRPRSNMASFSM